MEIRIFLFHRVSPERDLLWNPMTPELFEQIIRYLKRNFEIVPLEKTLLGMYQPASGKKYCAITFDDGYKDFVQYAFPILQKYQVPSSMYVITNSVENDTPPWTYLINHLFINTSHLSIDLNSKALPLKLQQTKWKNQKERLHYAKLLSPFLKHLNNSERILIYEQILNDFNDVEMPEGLMMNWGDVEYVFQNGCEIGSHSVSHPLLAKKSNIVQIADEMVESGKIIQNKTGKFPLAFAYPFGSYNELIKKTVKNAGYKIALTVNSHSYNSERKDLFEIPRVELYAEPFLKSRMRINGMIQKINNFFGLALLLGVIDV